MKTKGIFGTRSARLDLFKPGKSRTTIRLVLAFLLTLLIISSAVGLAVAEKVPSERRVRKAVEELNFLPEESKHNLVLSIRTGAKDGLLSFSGGIGTRTLLKVIASQNSPAQKKTQLIEIIQGAIKEDLPLFLVSKTAIRMLRTGAPFDTVLNYVRREIDLLSNISLYLKRDDAPLYLTYRNRARLIDTLAESVVTYTRQKSRSDDARITADELNHLERTLHNMVKFSSLPVSLQAGTGVKGGSGGKENNPQLASFLKDRGTIRDLAQLARDFSPED